MTAIQFFAPGIPRPGGSKRAFRTPGGRMIVVDAGGERTHNWRAVVALSAKAAYSGPPLSGPLAMHVEFRMPRPKSHYRRGQLRPDAPRYHTARPDTLKLLRSTEDALTGIIWVDDAQNVVVSAQKLYSNAECGAMIVIGSCDEPSISADSGRRRTSAPG